jgi:hypothetical protein
VCFLYKYHRPIYPDGRKEGGNLPANDLYLVVLPLMHLSTGLAEQTLTLLPNREFATEFFADEVDGYIEFFKNRANKYMTGGHVTDYQTFKQETHDGQRFIVRVVQNVS